jgi:isopenicillin N synthase-like dioxygenase
MVNDQVPLLDLETATGGEIAAALESASCVFVVGHGVPAALRTEMADVSREFFHLPRAVKARVEWPGVRPWTGWQPVHEWPPDVSGYGVPDLVERFEVRLPLSGAPPAGAERMAWAGTFPLWPRHPERMAAVWTDFYAEAAALSSTLMRLLADAYDLPTDQLPAWTDRQFSNLVTNWYPPQHSGPPLSGSPLSGPHLSGPPLSGPPLSGPAAGSIRQHAHTDIGGLTLLWADDAPGGLEVRFPGRRDWRPVSIHPDAFLVQAGDLLARWTNHRVRANVHRVVNPPASVAATAERTSVVFFHHPDLEADVRPAPSCVPPGQRAARSVNARTHVIHRQSGRPSAP